MGTGNLVTDLNDILTAKRQQVAERKRKTPIEAIRALASLQKRPLPVLNTVTGDDPVMLIGLIRYEPDAEEVPTRYDPVTLAVRFAQAGADAITLFTDSTLYEGGRDDLMFIARAVRLPVITQDYVLEEYQVVEARAAGASAIMLSAAVLDAPTLRALVSATQRNRMTAIVSVSSEAELETALSISPQVICLNNRNPYTQQIDPGLAARLRPHVPSHMRVMMTGGLRTLADVEAAMRLNLDALLVGEPLLGDPNTAHRVRDILNNASSL